MSKPANFYPTQDPETQLELDPEDSNGQWFNPSNQINYEENGKSDFPRTDNSRFKNVDSTIEEKSEELECTRSLDQEEIILMKTMRKDEKDASMESSVRVPDLASISNISRSIAAD